MNEKLEVNKIKERKHQKSNRFVKFTSSIDLKGADIFIDSKGQKYTIKNGTITKIRN